jgi:2,3,4,5-tetrahydropyridine-2,6-dicarboxylate N-succinyltransferase
LRAFPPEASEIDALWARRDVLGEGHLEELASVAKVIQLLDDGSQRVAQMVDGDVIVNEWLRRAILLLFTLAPLEVTEIGPFAFRDRIPLKRDFEGVRAAPGATVRWGAHIEPGAILMPSFVNIGARVGRGTMVDTWATVGSCAQIGAHAHLSGGVGIGGVLEPAQSYPVMVGDGALIGSRSVLVEGARVGEGAVVGAGTILSGSIPVIDSETGEEIARGVIPPWTVAVNAVRQREFPGGSFGLPCALVIGRLEPGKRHAKAELSQLLRGHGSL